MTHEQRCNFFNPFNFLTAVLIAQMCCGALAQAQSPKMTGKWNVEITFANAEHRSVRFEAQGEGKGTFDLLDPKAKVWGAATSSKAKWSRAKETP